MVRRGPDQAGRWGDDHCVLLHRRLAVIDPEGGRQPMELMWQGRLFIMVYNGELYNTEEIRERLMKLHHKFFGHSDTEVLLHAFAQWGEGALELCNGIFSFAVWEPGKKQLFLARDPMGVKPLFYAHCNGGLVFGSEIKTVLAHPEIEKTLDLQSIAEMVIMGPGRTPVAAYTKELKKSKQVIVVIVMKKGFILPLIGSLKTLPSRISRKTLPLTCAIWSLMPSNASSFPTCLWELSFPEDSIPALSQP